MSAKVEQAAALFYFPYLHGLAEEVSDVHNEEKFKQLLPSTLSTPAAGRDFDSSESKFNVSDLLGTARDGMESKPQIENSPSKTAGHEICSGHVDYQGMSSMKQEICIQQLRDLLETARDGMESKPQIENSPSKTAGHEICIDYQGTLSMKQEMCIQQLRDLVETARDGMESKPQIENSPSKTVGHEICSGHVDYQGMSSMKQEICIQQLRDLLETARDGMESKPQIENSPSKAAGHEICIDYQGTLSMKQEICIQQLRDLVETARDGMESKPQIENSPVKL